MSDRPLLLGLFCGAGGAAMGYHRAGFDVIGVDIRPQPNYPFRFMQADALDVLDRPIAYLGRNGWHRVRVLHASPPCQAYSVMSQCRPDLEYPRLIEPVRERFVGYPWLPHIIENVPGAPLREPVILCGHMVGLDLYRHRLFECSFPVTAPTHPRHEIPVSRAGHWVPGTVMSVAGHVAPIAKARAAMGIDWMTREELVEAIPPAYTEFIGRQLLTRVYPL